MNVDVKRQEHSAVAVEAPTTDGEAMPEPRPRTRRGRSNAAPAIPHLTPTERAALGKAARVEAPRASHAAFTRSANGFDPVALLEEQAVSRVPELVPIRYGRMLVSPFTYYRGAALPMAADLATTPSSGLRVQLCGDAHLSNFGVFGSPERRMIFSLNDFDETLPGPWEWDLKRLAASFAVAGRDNSYTRAQRRKIVLTCAQSYHNGMIGFAAMSNLAVWYAQLDVDTLMSQLRAELKSKHVKTVESNLAKARTRDSVQAFAKLATDVDGEPRIISNPPLIVPIEDLLPDEDRAELMAELTELLSNYRRTLETDRRHLIEQFRFVHLARKVVGVGSVGTRAWIGLLLGRDGQDPLFLQMKEAQPSVLARFAGTSEYTNQGQRVVAGQRLMQTASDIFLGWERITGIDGDRRDFYIRQLRDWKGSAEIDGMDPKTMTVYAQMCGWTLARAHARSGDRIAIAAYLGSGKVFDNAIADFAETYADQNERDYRALVDAVGSGRIEARTGL
jgi:uncharacterized protein (DUF2252 family)